MSKIKITPDLFLEVCELNKLMNFMKEDGYQKILKYVIKSYGVVRDSQNLFLKVNQSLTSNYISINPGIAIDLLLNIIVLNESYEMPVADDGNKHWITIKYKTTNFENGTISVSNNGILTGVGTEFTKVLRGGNNYPNKVRLDSSFNINDYVVLKVLSDTSAILSGPFTAETLVKYSAVGTFTPGVLVLEENKLLYEYDSFDIIDILSDVEPILEDGQYFLAEVEYDNGTMSVNDLRNNALFNQTSGSNSNSKNPITSLLKSQLTGEKQIDLIIEHGYTVSSFSFFPQSDNNLFRIIGSSNFLGTGNITNDYFKGWVLLNRANMKRALISGNTNKDLLIPTMDAFFIESANNDFVIIPNFKEIEYEIKVSGNAYPIYKKFNIDNIVNRFSIPVEYGNNTIGLKYRMIGDFSTVLDNLCLATFVNVLGDNEVLGNSNFVANIIQTVLLQNYS